MEKKVLTSVKLDPTLFDAFRIECVRTKFSFQKLAERSMHLFQTDPEFKKKLLNHLDLTFEEKKD